MSEVLFYIIYFLHFFCGAAELVLVTEMPVLTLTRRLRLNHTVIGDFSVYSHTPFIHPQSSVRNYSGHNTTYR